MSQPLPTGAFTLNDALSTLLTTESLLFAAFNLAVNLSDSSSRVRGWLIPGGVLVGAAVTSLAVVAFGAGIAWNGLFLRNGLSDDWSQRFIALALIAAIGIQPLLAFFLAMGLRTQE
jgi:hypothetical protein